MALIVSDNSLLEESMQLITVSIDDVTNRLEGYRESENQYHISENQVSLATGEVEFVDQKFTVPFLRVDTNRTQYMPATIKDGKFSIELNFKTAGKWIVNTRLLNSELSKPLFKIDEQTFFVI